MAAIIRLPDGRTAEKEFSAIEEAGSSIEAARLSLYFSEKVDLQLADTLELSFVRVVEIEKISWLDGISLQLQLEEGAPLQPSAVQVHCAGNAPISGSIVPGLFNWFWNIRIPGPVPEGPFRLSIQFS